MKSPFVENEKEVIERVQEALDNLSKYISHEEAMKQFRDRIKDK